MEHDELDDRLALWGDAATPELDGAFANRLESDLRAQRLDDARRPTGRGLLALLMRPATLLALGVVLVVGFFLLRADRDDGAVVLVAADRTSVSIPGSPTTTDGVAGLELPDGSRIRVAVDGSAIVSGVVLEPGMSAEIVDGELEILAGDSADGTTSVPPSPDSTPATSAQPRSSGPVTSANPTSSTTAPPTSRPTATGVSSTNSPTTAAPTTAVPTTNAPTTSTSSPPTTDATTTTTTSTTRPTDRAIQVSLTIGGVRNQQAVLSWQVDGPADSVAGWEVRIRRGDETRRVALLRDGGARRLRVEVPARTVEYKVIARASDGTLLAESQWVPLP